MIVRVKGRIERLIFKGMDWIVLVCFRSIKKGEYISYFLVDLVGDFIVSKVDILRNLNKF